VVRPALSLLFLGLMASAPAGPPANGTELLQQMHDAYAGKWYKTLTFVQKTSFPDGKTETWYEAAEIPGKLRIDVAPLDSQKTILFRADSIYEYEGGSVKQSQAMIHPLMVLGFDVYSEPVAVTATKLTSLGFDLGPVREDTVGPTQEHARKAGQRRDTVQRVPEGGKRVGCRRSCLLPQWRTGADGAVHRHQG
jgi:hypothetical protein